MEVVLLSLFKLKRYVHSITLKQAFLSLNIHHFSPFV